MNDCLQHTRDLTRGLSPLYVVGGSLRDALEQIEGPHPGSGPPVRVTVDPWFDDRVMNGMEADHLYRIALEAVRNARRHSEGSYVSVALRVARGELNLDIADDGDGISSTNQQGHGFGLRLMAYRARVIGATLTIANRVGGGTRVQVTIPNRVTLSVQID